MLCEAVWALHARSVPRETPWQSTVVPLTCEHETRPEASPQSEMETVGPTGNCPVTSLLIYAFSDELLDVGNVVSSRPDQWAERRFL